MNAINEREGNTLQTKLFYTRKELSEIFNCSLGTIDNWTASGQLQSYGIGNRVYFKVDEVHNSLIKL